MSGRNLIADRARFTSFHPFQNASKVKMMVTICGEFWIFFIIFCSDIKYMHLSTTLYFNQKQDKLHMINGLNS
jgi:hypothetical protein